MGRFEVGSMKAAMFRPKVQVGCLLLGLALWGLPGVSAGSERVAPTIREKMSSIANGIGRIRTFGRNARNNPHRACELLERAKTTVAETLGSLRELEAASGGEPLVQTRTRWLGGRLFRAATQLQEVERLFQDLSVAGQQVKVLRELSKGGGQDVGYYLGFPLIDSCLGDLAGAITRAAKNPQVRGRLHQELGVQGVKRALDGPLKLSIVSRLEELLQDALMGGASVDAVIRGALGAEAFDTQADVGQRGFAQLRSFVSEGRFNLALAEQVIQALAQIGVSVGQVAGDLVWARQSLNEGQRQLEKRAGGAQHFFLFQ